MPNVFSVHRRKDMTTAPTHTICVEKHAGTTCLTRPTLRSELAIPLTTEEGTRKRHLGHMMFKRSGVRASNFNLGLSKWAKLFLK